MYNYSESRFKWFPKFMPTLRVLGVFLNPINFQHPAIMRTRFNGVVIKPQRANSNIDED